VTVVIDANALVALIASEPDGPAVSELIERWTAEERELHAPALARYEIANVLARQHAVGRLSKEDVKSGWQALEELPITYHALIDGPAVIDVAAMLGRRSAFDASYVALARVLDAECGHSMVRWRATRLDRNCPCDSSTGTIGRPRGPQPSMCLRASRLTKSARSRRSTVASRDPDRGRHHHHVVCAPTSFAH
jgi:predicted nucleic acid-binding protein